MSTAAERAAIAERKRAKAQAFTDAYLARGRPPPASSASTSSNPNPNASASRSNAANAGSSNGSTTRPNNTPGRPFQPGTTPGGTAPPPPVNRSASTGTRSHPPPPGNQYHPPPPPPRPTHPYGNSSGPPFQTSYGPQRLPAQGRVYPVPRSGLDPRPGRVYPVPLNGRVRSFPLSPSYPHPPHYPSAQYDGGPNGHDRYRSGAYPHPTHFAYPRSSSPPRGYATDSRDPNSTRSGATYPSSRPSRFPTPSRSDDLPIPNELLIQIIEEVHYLHVIDIKLSSLDVDMFHRTFSQMAPLCLVRKRWVAIVRSQMWRCLWGRPRLLDRRDHRPMNATVEWIARRVDIFPEWKKWIRRLDINWCLDQNAGSVVRKLILSVGSGLEELSIDFTENTAFVLPSDAFKEGKARLKRLALNNFQGHPLDEPLNSPSQYRKLSSLFSYGIPPRSLQYLCIRKDNISPTDFRLFSSSHLPHLKGLTLIPPPVNPDPPTVGPPPRRSPSPPLDRNVTIPQEGFELSSYLEVLSFPTYRFRLINPPWNTLRVLTITDVIAPFTFPAMPSLEVLSFYGARPRWMPRRATFREADFFVCFPELKESKNLKHLGLWYCPIPHPSTVITEAEPLPPPPIGLKDGSFSLGAGSGGTVEDLHLGEARQRAGREDELQGLSNLLTSRLRSLHLHVKDMRLTKLVKYLNRCVGLRILRVGLIGRRHEEILTLLRLPKLEKLHLRLIDGGVDDGDMLDIRRPEEMDIWQMPSLRRVHFGYLDIEYAYMNDPESMVEAAWEQKGLLKGRPVGGRRDVKTTRSGMSADCIWDEWLKTQYGTWMVDACDTTEEMNRALKTMH
ncbi:hypothetical protein BT69DRAFT_1337770 [Atractiella rhizophila]|nr:hypothetical protein BT69DRAFT_1337770 [Atractiella rhizophila]